MRGDTDRVSKYIEAAKKIRNGLSELYDKNRHAYMDKRNGIFMWNTSTNFGVLWGFPNTPELVSTNDWYLANTQKLGGGMQYFDAQGYGHDVFFFNTAAAAQYQAIYGNSVEYRKMANWMLNHLNIYGLTPERIYLDESGASPASPLSWCMGEFALALLEGYNRGLMPTKANDMDIDK